MLRARKKISKKELKHDPLLEMIFKVETFFRNYSKEVGYGVIGIVALVIVGVMLMNSKSEAEVDAAAAVGIAQFKYVTGDFQDAIVRLEDALRKYPGTDAATQGLFYLGSANYQANNKNDAEKYFRDFLDENSDDALLVASAYAGIAAVREDNEDFTEAANFYREAADKAESQFQVEMYTISAVRNFHKSGRSEIALKLITNMLDDDKVSLETKNSAEYLKSIISTEKG